MARLLGLTRAFGEWAETPREVTRTIPTSESIGENGWLIRFFDSAFFSEWIAVSYLYKHDHPGVRDYLCNRMYALPLSGLENYLFQICYMLIHKPSPSLDKFVIDICSKSLKIALKVHWFLMAELEDVDDNEGISRIQEKCQVAATLMGEWPPLVKPHSRSSTFMSSFSSNNDSGSSSSPTGKSQVLNRLLSSKQKLLSMTSSPPNSVSVPRSLSISSSPGSSNVQDDGGKVVGSPEDSNKIFKKFIPGPKMRDALSFRKSMDKEDDEPEKEGGFFKKLLRDSRDEDAKKAVDRNRETVEESEKDGGFLKRLLRDSRDEDVRKSVGKDRENDDEPEKDGGFFKRLLRDSRDEDVKKSLGKDKKNGEEFEKDSGFFKRLLRDKDEDVGKSLGKDKEIDEEPEKDVGFFKRLLRDSRDDDTKKSVDKHKAQEEQEKDGGFLKRLLSSSRDDDMKQAVHKNEEELEKDGFFRRLLSNKDEEEEASSSTDGFFKRLFRDSKNEQEVKLLSKAMEDEEKEGFFKKLFKDKFEDKKDGSEKNDDPERVARRSENDDREGFIKKFFKEMFDDKKDLIEHNDEERMNHANGEDEDSSEFLLFRRLFRVHPEDSKISMASDHTSDTNVLESSPGTENFFQKLFKDRDRSVEDSELYGHKKSNLIFTGSLKQQHKKQNDKPPLPDNASHYRKGAYHESLDFVQALCETSYGLVDVFPVEDRKTALRESLVDINVRIDDAQSSGGICFPMGKGMCRVVHIPEDEAVLLNSREKAPYLICVEVLKSEAPSNSKDSSSIQKLSKGGIPLANGDALLPKPPQWACPLGTGQDMYHNSYDRMSRSTSEAIDQAMSQSWEANVKFVHVELCVEKQSEYTNQYFKSQPVSTNHSHHGEGGCACQLKGGCDLEWVRVVLSAEPGISMDDVVDRDPPRRKEHRRVPSTVAIAEVKAAALKGEAPPGLPLKGAGQDSSDAQPKAANGGLPKFSEALSGELWELKKDRIRKSSLYGKLPGWDLRSAIVKSGDDCRQEHLAVQLISHFYDIFQEAGLPLWLRPYEVLVTSSYTALIETIPDTRNFVESMAGYSLVCYLLQVKDRHNGNLLLDEEGHIIHIDFGFMLSNSPGGVNFESAPFKLTRELLEVMDSDAEGIPSEFFDYFKVLCIQGFLTCRKHAERIILLVEMLQDSDFPCFKGGPRTIQNLRKRFHLSLPEEQCVSLVLSLISSSLDAWRTRQYDYYQRVLNGIL
ncbi:phosphatidylinositol 4-kinase beta 1-like isoform X2 [Andrographis paniculata]|uniref:phosphatidylinositol 4-kinase beta 1-like isoform X2 n=1 Tax=Andrographis paniculata TaxID=175694 RepID=UPI0021E96713|nr:phosphatidylinositol 4-kinase beta 1-like isoform X2 [Andrographis paniculata]